MATDRVVVEGSSVTAPQLSDLFRQIGDGSLTSTHIQALLDHRNPFEVLMDTESQFERARKLFLEAFNITLPDGVYVPERKPGFDRLILVPKGLTLNLLIEVFRTKFDVWTYVDDIDKLVIKNDRINEMTYAVWVRDRVEADEENARKSAEMLESESFKGITLMERLVYELLYYSETKKHLDVKNQTLCSGSRHSGGFVPVVCWFPGHRKLCVHWYGAQYSSGPLRARKVVS